ncbi:7-cyano-7-deazaguanine synthase [Mesorhizobium sangaii]|uniref:7-cyano-7-deazaguanine synthase in queuosine biosynthesis n=1 Tax=Mesorhizobium sangaii TaxID=505389 RepID=A0A841PED0_9HYPH|nr:7-cyano-7-deazaguanine synthase in queuosine biosynthesis [Mesorhizobium sangaii]
MTEALTDATEFMTDDDVDFEFSRSAVRARSSIFLDFDQSSAFMADEVILFSGGLDSLAGVVEKLATTDARLALVTHRSAQKRMPHQDWLAARLKERFPGRILWIPIKARRSAGEASETTQRSRPLLFAALGFLVSHILDTRQLLLFENGVVSQNLPISPQVIGSLATRTTHPLVVHRLGHLLRLMTGEPFEFSNPYTWLTKTQVVSRLRDHGATDLIAESVSCSEVHNRTVVKTHCGACSQCIDRRFAMIANGMGEYDPASIYETEVLTDTREKSESRTMALDWTRHAHSLANMDDLTFLERFGSEIGRIIEGFPDQPSRQTALNIMELQRRHGQAVQETLAWGVKNYSAELIAGALPATSLLRMFLSVMNGQATMPDTATLKDRYAIQDQDLKQATSNKQNGIFPLRLTLSGEEKSCRLTVAGLGEVKGVNASVVVPMRPVHDEDVGGGRVAKEFRFTASGAVAAALNPTSRLWSSAFCAAGANSKNSTL